MKSEKIPINYEGNKKINFEAQERKEYNFFNLLARREIKRFANKKFIAIISNKSITFLSPRKYAKIA